MNKELRETFRDWSDQVVLILQAVAAGSSVTRKQCDDLAALQNHLDLILQREDKLTKEGAK